MLLSLLLFSSIAQAKEVDRIHGFRMGICGGVSTECILSSMKFEFSGRFVGLNLAWPAFPVWGTTNLKIYPLEIREEKVLSWRPYAYGGAGFVIMVGGIRGGGVGADIHLSSSRRLLLQPSVGVHEDSKYRPSGALAIMYSY